ncbi:MAG: DUF2726 domain-containing protein [Azonexaceae bacterium]|uniref:DUF2726 domain-containing protein n=1 Tax=Azonexus sp. R2A61 TaxID=2744443 RepID=UPI001F3E104C|nr:DUF2726 domain-containing protein [Azonexus sp. R2A61]MCE1241035.1 DUF2726 domain-containing protein [Azonexaceae bacterium]
MDYLSLGLVVAAVLLVAFLVLRRRDAAPLPEPAYQPMPAAAPRPAAKAQQQLDLDPQTRFVDMPKRKPYRLLNDSEQELYHRLCEAMPNMLVFAQVGVAQLALARGRQEAQRLARMAGRGVDFVVCDTEFSIIAAIELAWPTTASDTAEDEKRAALQSLGVPLIVFRPNKLPDADTIGREIADAIVRRNRMESERG